MLFSLAVLASSTIFLCLSVIKDGAACSASSPCANMRTDRSEWVSILISVSLVAEISNWDNIDKQDKAPNLHKSTDMWGRCINKNMNKEHSKRKGRVLRTNFSSDNLDTLFSASNWLTWDSNYLISKSPNDSDSTYGRWNGFNAPRK